MFEKVLFPTDFSSNAKTELGCLMAFPDIREIHLLHVVRAFPIPVVEKLMTRTTRQYLREAKKYLESLSPEIAVSMEVAVSTDIPGTILASAEKAGADLIAVSGYATDYRAAILLGKVPATVLCRASTTNVLVMPNELIASLGGPVFRKFCPYLFSTILCPTDFSAFSQDAIAAAAATRGVRTILLLHVLQEGKACRPLTPHEAEDRLRALRDAIARPRLEDRNGGRDRRPRPGDRPGCR